MQLFAQHMFIFEYLATFVQDLGVLPTFASTDATIPAQRLTDLA